MSFPSRTMRKFVVAAAVSAAAAMFGYAYSSQPSPSVSAALAKSSGGPSGGPAAAIVKRATSGIWGPGSSTKDVIPYTLIQTTPTTVQEPDATSAATGITSDETKGAAEASSEVVSGASEESAVKDAAYCLKCHGPFEKLAARTKDYVTEWDESANPHVYVPHDSKSIVECSECHDPHAIPFAPSEDARKPNVDYCYSCHHAQTLVNCNQCHNE